MELRPGEAGQHTSRQSATNQKPHNTLRLMLIALFGAAAAAGVLKVWNAHEAAEELKEELSQPLMKMPDSASPASNNEPVGIVADKKHGEDNMGVMGKNTEMPDPATAMKALELSRNMLPVLNQFGTSPVVQQFKHEFAKDPELVAMLNQLQKDGNVNTFIKGMNGNAAFQQMIKKYMSDPRFAGLMQRAQEEMRKQGGPRPASGAPKMVVAPAAPPPAAPDPAAGSPDPLAGSPAPMAGSPLPPGLGDEEPAPESPKDESPAPTIDPGMVSGSDSPGRAATPAPPAPKVK
jgi:hypothetical protein